MNRTNIFEATAEDIMKMEGIDEGERSRLLTRVMQMKKQRINLLLTGATGSGKSSTVNALFDTSIASVGTGSDPETMDIEKYEMDNLVIWDTPGLGDGKEADNRHAKAIIDKLNEVDEEGNALIDMVLVILDGSSRDLGTSYELINEVIIPNIGEQMKDRVLVAINQADMAMKGRNWDVENNRPNEELKRFLDEKADSVRRRIYEGTGVDVDPVYYSAGYTETDGTQCRPYNLSKLMYYVVKATPIEKRAIYANNINNDGSMWKDDDELRDYTAETKGMFLESIVEGATAGADIGEKIGSFFFGEAGAKIGRAAGTIGGVVWGAAKHVLSSIFG